MDTGKLAGQEAEDKGQWLLQCGMSIKHTEPGIKIDLLKVAPWYSQTFCHFSLGVQLLKLVDRGP